MKSNIDIALLLIRLGLGTIFVAHGYAKITGMEGTIEFFANIGLSSVVWAYLVAWVELLGGAAMVLGVFTGSAGILLACVMVGAIVFAKIERGFVGGYEFDLMLFLASIAIALGGAGAYTIKNVWRKG